MLVNGKRMAAVAMVFLGVACAPAFATPVTFYFGGEITRVDDPIAVLPVPLEVGDLFLGSYTFLGGTQDSDPGDETTGAFENSITAFDLRVGDVDLQYPGSFGSLILIRDREISVGIDSYIAGGAALLHQLELRFQLSLSDHDGSFLVNDLLNHIPPDLAMAERAVFQIVSEQSLGLSIEGTIQQFSNVPEPATGVLALIGGMVVILRRRKGAYAGQGVRVRSAVRPRAVWVAAVLGVAASSGYATPVTFYFGGEITRADDANGLLQGGIEVGDSFFGSYTFELEQPDTVPADPNYADYLGAVRAVSVRVGDITLTSPFGTIVVGNDRPISGLDFYQVAWPVRFGNHVFDFSFTLIDRDGEFVTSDALLTVPPSLALSEIDSFGFGRQGTGVIVRGDLELLSIVPEPATGVLAIVGGMLAMLRRGKQGVRGQR